MLHFMNSSIDIFLSSKLIVIMFKNPCLQNLRFKKLWIKSMNELVDRLVGTTHDGLQYVAEENGGHLQHRMDHLACFVGGMLVLGAHELPAAEVNPKWVPFAEKLTETCYKMYRLAPHVRDLIS
jgi:hypothetical protein